jgi:Restriction endonuclease EcoRV
MPVSDNRTKRKEKLKNQLTKLVTSFNSAVSTKEGDWIIKGFIDIARNIYTISVDTKVISKIMEILLFPNICRFAQENGYKIILCKEQNFYPDITFIDGNNNKFAVDIKSTYRKNDHRVNGMTLGAFTGYFRDRNSTKNITFPYNEYVGHFVLGVIYSRTDEVLDEQRTYQLDDLKNITSVIRDFDFFIQEKYEIAIDRPGSGNTKNIGSITQIDRLIHGGGPFAELGEDVYDDYWMYYLTKDMARAIDLPNAPYKNLKEYIEYKKLKR